MKKTALVLILWMGSCGLFSGQVLGGTELMNYTLYGYGAGVSLVDGDNATMIGVFDGAATTGSYKTFVMFSPNKMSRERRVR